jgi:hypothetical protein
MAPVTQTIEVKVDVARLHALAALIEKHAGAFRADLEKLMAGEPGGEIREN